VLVLLSKPSCHSGAADEALTDVKSAIQFHIETFGAEVLLGDSPVAEAFIAEATIPA
jgi:hypothetical protein